VGEPRDFEEIYRAEVPLDAEHWHYNARREVRLAEPAERVFVRYVGDPALNNFHVYAHCTDDGRPSAGPVKITHTWLDGGRRKTRTVTLRGPGQYEIDAGADPADESIEISVPSDRP
jgi:hypothetical protein